MKFLDFYKSSRKCFSIRKFIKPLHSQEFYNSMFYQRIKDKVLFKYNYITINFKLEKSSSKCF